MRCYRLLGAFMVNISLCRHSFLCLNFSFTPIQTPEKYLAEAQKSGIYTGSAKLYADGGSRGNPGPSASGFVVLDELNRLLHADNKYLGLTTNNQAEYHALIQGMEWCVEKQIPTLHVYLDSLLVVNQLKGVFKVKNRDLWSLYTNQQKSSVLKFKKFTITHVPRELNKLSRCRGKQGSRRRKRLRCCTIEKS
jgi:ribonuclease HI